VREVAASVDHDVVCFPAGATGDRPRWSDGLCGVTRLDGAAGGGPSRNRPATLVALVVLAANETEVASWDGGEPSG
jgi:hypothetical protein